MSDESIDPWMPIATAPTNPGASILAHVEGADGRPMIFVAHWMNPKTMFSSVHVGHENPADYEWVSGMMRITQPTEWMPVPAPPRRRVV